MSASSELGWGIAQQIFDSWIHKSDETIRIDDDDGVCGVLGNRSQLRSRLLGLLFDPVSFDRINDPISENLVLACSRFLLEVIGNAGRDSFASHLLTPLPRIQDEWKFRIIGPNDFEKADPVLAWHVIIRDNAVKLGPCEFLNTVLCPRCSFDLKPIVLAFEEIGC